MLRLIPTTLLCLVLTAGIARAQGDSARINRALDENIERLDFDETPLVEAMDEITAVTGVPLAIDDAVWRLLPWGRETVIMEGRIRNQTLREALTEITQKLGLEFHLQEEAVVLRPMPALRRVPQRPTAQELEALDLLASHPIELDDAEPTIRQLVEAIDAKLVELESPFAVEFRPGEDVDDERAVPVARNATLMQALESIPNNTDATWYPWGDKIQIVPKQVQIKAQLAREINVRIVYENQHVKQVLLDLTQRSGVPFTFEPGAIQRVPADFQTINLEAENASVREILETLSGFTGLVIEIRKDDVYISHGRNGNGNGANGRENGVGDVDVEDDDTDDL